MGDTPPPFDESLMPAHEPAALGDIALTEQHMAYAAERWPDVTEKMQAYRIRQAIWARFQISKPHPDDPTRRLLGGPQPNSGPKAKKAIGAAIVEEFEGRQREVLDAIAAPLDSDSGATPMERHKAGMNIAKHAREEQREQREADLYARLTEDEVRRSYAKMIADAVKSGEISMEDIFEGTATEVPAEQRQIAS